MYLGIVSCVYKCTPGTLLACNVFKKENLFDWIIKIGDVPLSFSWHPDCSPKDGPMVCFIRQGDKAAFGSFNSRHKCTS